MDIPVEQSKELLNLRKKRTLLIVGGMSMPIISLPLLEVLAPVYLLMLVVGAVLMLSGFSVEKKVIAAYRENPEKKPQEQRQKTEIEINRERWERKAKKARERRRLAIEYRNFTTALSKEAAIEEVVVIIGAALSFIVFTAMALIVTEASFLQAIFAGAFFTAFGGCIFGAIAVFVIGIVLHFLTLIFA